MRKIDEAFFYGVPEEVEVLERLTGLPDGFLNGSIFLWAYSYWWGQRALEAKEWLPKAKERLTELITTEKPCQKGWECHFVDFEGGWTLFPADSGEIFSEKFVPCPYWDDWDCPEQLAIRKRKSEELALQTENKRGLK